MPLVGIVRTYPKFSSRSAKTISLIERIDECLTRSLNGRALPETSSEMQSFLAYLRFINEPQAEPATAAPAASLPPDAARGITVSERAGASAGLNLGSDLYGPNWRTAPSRATLSAHP